MLGSVHVRGERVHDRETRGTEGEREREGGRKGSQKLCCSKAAYDFTHVSPWQPVRTRPHRRFTAALEDRALAGEMEHVHSHW